MSSAVGRKEDALDCRLNLDLPSGRDRLGQSVDSYVATVADVNGTVTYREDAPTGALPGHLVRGLRQAQE
jgi:N-acyl-D-amino-acid deacylase